MRRNMIFLVLLVCIFISGCTKSPANKQIMAKINGYEISKDEFEAQFRESIYARRDTVESRREFLDYLIDRKLILQDAQTRGQDKEPGFLKMIEKFWEQSLLKISLDRKASEIIGSVSVGEKEIRSLYDTMLKEGKTTKSYQQMYKQLRQELIRQKESQAMNAWFTQLRRNAKIQISADLFKQKYDIK